MSDDLPNDSPEDRPLQQIEHSAATARVLDSIGRGVFATGAVVLHGPNEFMVDFIQSMVRPSRVAARVILPPKVAEQFTAALGEALGKYAQSFGGLPADPARQAAQKAAQQGQAAAAGANPDQPAAAGQPAGAAGAGASGGAEGRGAAPRQEPPIADIYEQLKLPDEMLGGAYANVVSITHTSSEFCFDFVAQFFPRSAVTARVYMAAARVPDLHGSLKRSTGM
jgi:hypothetical protein